MRHALALAFLVAAVLASSAAQACSPVIHTDPATGETWASFSPESFRRQQAAWRAEADAVFIAQAREARMIAGGEVEFLLVPITGVDGGPVPDAMLLFRWNPGNTCNAFPLSLTDLVVVYADMDQFGWGVVGLTIPDQLQDAPDDFPQRVRDIRRGIILGPALPE